MTRKDKLDLERMDETADDLGAWDVHTCHDGCACRAMADELRAREDTAPLSHGVRVIRNSERKP